MQDVNHSIDFVGWNLIKTVNNNFCETSLSKRPHLFYYNKLPAIKEALSISAKDQVVLYKQNSRRYMKEKENPNNTLGLELDCISSICFRLQPKLLS